MSYLCIRKTKQRRKLCISDRKETKQNQKVKQMKAINENGEKIHIQKRNIEKILKYGYIKLDAVVGGNSSGTHKFSIEDGEVKCYGQGSGWSDQDDESSFSIPEVIKHIWANRDMILEVCEIREEWD
jgi:hypothetical protein